MQNLSAHFFDTHVHLDRLGPGRSLQRELGIARRLGVRRFLVPGVRPWDWEGLVALVREQPDCLAAPGCHPLAAAYWDEGAGCRLEALLTLPEVVALGEVGLDLGPDMPCETVQERAFREQIRLAVAAGKPLLIHCRKSTEKTLHILRQERADAVGGILHGFSGSVETARQAIALGFAIGFGGTVTWPGARRAPEVLRAIPQQFLVLETDAPDLTPHPHRGEPNHPAYLLLVARKVAWERGWSLEQTAEITSDNAQRVLCLSHEPTS